jgi:predicted glycoside hydrolase/deacetylase ChbG (UPF0249 family)
MPVRLITRGDDAASSRSANFAIREAFLEGILRNASVLACTDLLGHARETLGDLPGLCIGLHATIACEWATPRWRPVLPPERVPSLVDGDGFLLPSPTAVDARGACLPEIMAEIAAQLARLRQAGFAVSYLDLHMSFGWIDGVDAAVGEFCRREGLIIGYREYDRLREVPPVSGDRLADLHAALAAAAPGTYLLVGHPTYDDDEMRAFRHHPPHRPPGPERDEQRRMFLDPRVMTLFRQGRIAPVRYDD